MRALLDTRAFPWWTTDDRRVSRRVREMLGDRRNHFLFSAASAWELIIKAQLGKVKLAVHAARFIRKQLALNAFGTLPIDLAHALHVHTLPMHHRDPFAGS